MKWFLVAAAVVCHVAYAEDTCQDGKELCFECQGDDETACNKRGSWTVCEGPHAVCEEVTTNGAHGLVVHFKRTCAYHKTCAAKSCEGVKCEGNETIECKPCECDKSCPPDEPLYCFTCKHRDDHLCWISGRYELCAPRSTCFHVERDNYVRRGCMANSKCHALSIAGKLTCGLYPQDATPPAKSVSTCGIPDFCTCSCKGDPHCFTFDKKEINNMTAGCWHTFARDGCVNKVPAVEYSFIVSVKLTGSKGIFISAVKVTFHNSTIVMDQTKGTAWVDGVEKTLPHNFMTSANTTVTLYQIHNSTSDSTVAMIKLPNRVIVEWNFEREVSVHAPDTFREHMCGICGDFNSKSEDDYSYGPPDTASEICPGKASDFDAGSVTDGEVADNGNLFLFSWVSKLEPTDPVCLAECQ